MKIVKKTLFFFAFMLLNFTLESCQHERFYFDSSIKKSSKSVSFHPTVDIDEFHKIDANLFVDTSFDLDANIKEKYAELGLSERDRLALDKKYKNERLIVMQNRSTDPACAMFLQQQKIKEQEKKIKAQEIKIAAQMKLLADKTVIIEKYRKNEESNNSAMMTGISIGSIIATGAYYFYQK